jgi:hypothetical protein
MKVLYWNNCVKDVCAPKLSVHGSGKATTLMRVLCS